MSVKSFVVASLILLMGIAIGYGLSEITSSGMRSDGDMKGEKKVLYWVAPMDPNFRKPEPGKSPMGMDLIPVYEGDGDNNGDGDDTKGIKIDPSVVNNIGVRTAQVTRSSLKREIDTVGYLAQNDDLTQDIHVRTEGWIERLDVKTAGDRLKKGARLFQLYSPALVNAQAEYLQALKIRQNALTSAAEERLAALGISERQIKALRRSKKVSRLIDVYAPQDGYVVDLNVREGMFVKPRTTVMTVADLKEIWVNVEIYEGQATWVAVGEKAVMRLPFIPGRIWEGVVDYVYPTVDPKSRTVRTRLKFHNPDENLKPNMYAEITLFGKPQPRTLSIPREAVIRTGKQERVILALEKGKFRPAKVITGIEVGNRIEIIIGLEEGEKVVTSGQFLIDSEASLDASLLRISGNPLRDNIETSRTTAVATGVINSLMIKDRQLNITHDPIPDIGWPTMTMDFNVADGVTLKEFKPGDAVYFSLLKKEKNLFEITEVSKSKIMLPKTKPAVSGGQPPTPGVDKPAQDKPKMDMRGSHAGQPKAAGDGS